MKLLVFGEIIYDFYDRNNKFIGGAPLNFAAHMSLLGENSSLISAVGKDDLGKNAIETIRGFGVDTRFIAETDGYETGKCLVLKDQRGLPAYDIVENVAYDHIPCSGLSGEKYDCFYFGTLALRCDDNISTVTKILTGNSFDEVFTDLNIRPPFYSEKSIRLCLENSTIVKISSDELPTVSREIYGGVFETQPFCRKLSAEFEKIRLIIITLGDKGAYVYDCENSAEYSCPVKEAKVISTTGAGDSFGAAFLHRYKCGDSIEKCLEFASAYSAFVVSRKDAVPPDTKDFINSLSKNA